MNVREKLNQDIDLAIAELESLRFSADPVRAGGVVNHRLQRLRNAVHWERAMGRGREPHEYSDLR